MHWTTLSITAKECQNQIYEGKEKRSAATSFALLCCQMLLVNIGEKSGIILTCEKLHEVTLQQVQIIRISLCHVCELFFIQISLNNSICARKTKININKKNPTLHLGGCNASLAKALKIWSWLCECGAIGLSFIISLSFLMMDRGRDRGNRSQNLIATVSWMNIFVFALSISQTLKVTEIQFITSVFQCVIILPRINTKSQ